MQKVTKVTITAISSFSIEKINKILEKHLWDGSISYELDDINWTIEKTSESYDDYIENL
tara:strand:- start:516 stop:692 length:177 start_codon:yes stop_codon:yes gene_type:complete